MTTLNGHGAEGEGASSSEMPRAVRRGLFAGLALVVFGAVYLAIMRGPALLLDLSALGSQFFCL
jgi:hypothetical protein